MIVPTFSIIIPTYKRPHLLAKAICSVVNQTFGDFECIVVDDGCDPVTVKVVQQFNDRRIVLIRHASNKGTSAAYNSGIKASRGFLISILDDDDEYYPTFLKKMYDFFKIAPSRIGFAWTGIRRVKDSPEGEVLLYERVWPSEFRHKEEAYIAATTIGNGFGLTIRRECFDVVGLYDETFQVAEDTEHLFKLAKAFAFATIPEVLVKIHHHGVGQLTHPDNDRLRLELHERVLMENHDLVLFYPKLYDVHFRRLAEISYSLGMKRKGRQILLKLLKNRPMHLSWFLDFVCYEWSGIDAATVWGQSSVRKVLSRAKRSLYHRKYLRELSWFDKYREK